MIRCSDSFVSRLFTRLAWLLLPGVILCHPAPLRAQLNVTKLIAIGPYIPYPQGGGTRQLTTSTVTLYTNCTTAPSSQANDTLAWSENHPSFFVVNGVYTGGTVELINLYKQAFPAFTFIPPPDFDASLNKFWQWRVMCGTGGGGGGGATPKPNLTCTLPPGWSDKLVISKVPGTTTDGGGFLNTDTLYVDAAALNSGNATAPGGWNAKFYVDDVHVKTWSISGALNPSTYYAYADMAIGPLSPGTHVIKVVLDADSSISEGNEGDNTCQRTISVGGGVAVPNLSFYQPAGWPDKMVISTVTGTSTNSTTMLNTNRLYVDITPHNSGSANIYPPWTIRYYVDDEPVGEWEINTALNANTVFGNIIDKSIGYLTAGTHTVKVVLDADNAITEANESDNTCERTIVIGGTDGPNLTFKQPSGWTDKLLVSTSPDSYEDYAGTLKDTQQLYFRAAPLNNGTTAITASWRYRFFVDGVSLGGWIINTDLGARQYFMDLARESGPLPAGSHVIKVVVDLDNEIAETNEQDNTYERTITILKTPGLPDLTDARNYYDVSSSSVVPGGNLSLHQNIENLGDGAAGACSVKYYLSTNTTISTSDTLLGSAPVPYSARQPLSADRVDVLVTVPTGIAAGIYYLGWILDQEQAVTEGNENNNTGVFPNQISVVSQSVPVITEQPSSQTVTAGQTAVFSTAATGAPAPSYQWQFRSGAGSSWINTGANAAVLSIQNAQNVHAGQYQVVVTNGVGPGVTSQTATLTVTSGNPDAPPVIIQQPAGAAVTAGDTVTLSTTASGRELKYQWYTGSSGNTAVPVTGATGPSLTLSPMANVSYWARVSNPAGFVNSNAAAITVSTLPAGQTWTAVQSGITSTLWAVEWLGTQFIATGDAGRILTSPDGLAWMLRSSGTTQQLESVAWDGQEYVGAGAAGTIVSSPNGVDWTVRNSGTTAELNAVVRDGGYFWAAGPAGSLRRSSDGRTWTGVTANNGQGYNLRYLQGTLCLTGPSTLQTSSNGTAWTTRLTTAGMFYDDVTSNGATWLSVGSDGMVRLSTNQGQTWTAGQTVAGTWLRGAASDGTGFAVVGNGGVIYTSPDGTGWTQRTSPVTSVLHAVAWNGRCYVSVGENGVILRSAGAWTGAALTNYQRWAVSRGLTGAVAAGNADWDKDGAPNALEFASGTRPADAQSFVSPQPEVFWDGSGWHVRFAYPQAVQAGAAALIPETSSNGQTWTALTAAGGPDGTGFTEMRLWESVSPTLNPRRFFRLRYPLSP